MMAEIMTVNDGNFDEEILKSESPAAVLFKSMGCPYCKKMMPVMEALAGEYAGRVKMAALDVSEGQNRAIEYGILSVPQVLFFKDGQKVDEVRGAVPKDEVVKKIEGLLQ